VKNKMTVTKPTDRELVITRTFDAPRELVWDTMCNPAYLKRWVFCPAGWEMTECVEDARVGGKFRWAWSSPEGGMTMSGEYREVEPPVRAVRTEKFVVAGQELGEQLATLELAADGEKTHLTITLSYPSKEARDGAAASGMEHGMAAGYDRLDELLGK
jgi:uncharacterized protein YndB with AHSA1/START domain